MRGIPLTAHAVLDYLVGLLLLGAPWIFDISGQTIGSAVCLTMGYMVIMYSLFTDYKLSIFRAIPINAHLMCDLFSGLILVCFYAWSQTNGVKWPLAAIGGFQLLFVFFTGFRDDRAAEAHSIGYTDPHGLMDMVPATNRHA